MVPFYIIFGLLATLAMLDIYDIDKGQRRVALLLTTVVLILFAGLRYDTGDYFQYVDMFEQVVQDRDITASPDIGYTFLSIVLGLFTSNAVFLFLIVAMLAVSINIISYNDYTRYAFLAILFYFVHSYALKEMIQIRAGLACAISLYNVRNIGNKKFGKFLILQILAMSIHLGAVIFIVAYIVKKINFSAKTWYWIIAICFCIGMLYPFGALIKALPGMEILARVQAYSKWDEYAEGIGILTNMATLKQLFVSFICLYYYKTLDRHIKYFNVLLPAYLAATCWLMLWNDFAIVAARVATFLSIGEPILMVSFVVLVTPRSRPLMVALLIAVALLFLFTNMDPNKITPYQLAI